MLVDQNKARNKTLSPIERVRLSRASSRPKGMDVIKSITSSFEELHGDRLMGDDRAVICGIGEIGKKRCFFIAQQKGSSAIEKVHHNFGMMSPSGYRKALRGIKLAEKFSLPVISIIDTPGAYPGLDAEKNGQSRAIAENIFTMSTIKTPLIALILGEGCSGGALGIGVSDITLMLEHAYFSVISPEGCAAILWKDARKSALAAGQLKMKSEDLLHFSMIDSIIREGELGFSKDSMAIFAKIRSEVLLSIEKLVSISIEELLLSRYKKYRSF